MTDSAWQVFDLAEIKDKLTGDAVEYLEFLNVPALNCGVYFLAAGSRDDGQGAMTVQPVSKGMVIRIGKMDDQQDRQREIRRKPLQDPGQHPRSAGAGHPRGGRGSRQRVAERATTSISLRSRSMPVSRS